MACTLTATDGSAQLAAWQRFNGDHLLDVRPAPGQVSVEYTNVDDAAERLAALVRTEQTCCAFAEWRIQRGSQHLQRIVVGAEDGIASLTILDRNPCGPRSDGERIAVTLGSGPGFRDICSLAALGPLFHGPGTPPLLTTSRAVVEASPKTER